MKENTYVKIHADIVDSKAHDQIKLIKDSPAIKGLIAIMPDCLSNNTEVLTPNGFKLITDLDNNDDVANYDINTTKITFNKVKTIINRPLRSDEKVYSLNCDLFCNIVSTENHRNPLRNNNILLTKDIINETYLKNYLWAGCGLTKLSTKTINLNELLFTIWIVGDGNIKKTHNKNSINKRIRFGFKKERKINRVLKLCDILCIKPTVTKTEKQTTIMLNTKDSKRFIDIVGDDKKYPFEVLTQFGVSDIDIILREAIQVDGDYEKYKKHGTIRLNSSRKTDLDFFASLLAINGYNSRLIMRKINGFTHNKEMYHLNIIHKNKFVYNKNGLHNKKIHKSLSDYNENVVCIECDTGFFIARQNGRVFITGNCHPGAGCVIGFTGHFKDAVIPNIVGVDIGCGVIAYPLGNDEINFEELDKHIRKEIPLGFNMRNKPSKYISLTDQQIIEDVEYFFTTTGLKMKRSPGLQIGTLGGGNHFIEIGQSEDGDNFLLIHSGSRNIGKVIAEYYQKKAVEICKAMKISTPQGLEYLPYTYGGAEYIRYLRYAQKYAQLNRSVMIQHILPFFNIEFDERNVIESVHNYIGDDNIVRKGAISAYRGQKVIIPFNMSEGSIIGVGKSNKDYNFSAPHGSGRIHGRNVMKKMLRDGELTMAQFEESMEGVYSTSVKEGTIDESKFAYKSYTQIKKHLEATVDIQTWLKPVYNLKSD